MAVNDAKLPVDWLRRLVEGMAHEKGPLTWRERPFNQFETSL